MQIQVHVSPSSCRACWLRSLGLTECDLRTLGMLCEGMTMAEIGASEHITLHTVKSRVKVLHRKLDVSTRTQLVSKAYRMGLVN